MVVGEHAVRADAAEHLLVLHLGDRGRYSEI